jgi:hypothetical protein
VRRELDHRLHEELRRSLRNPHPESAELAEQGLDEWSNGQSGKDAKALVKFSTGKEIRWDPEEGWVQDWA